MPTKKQKVEVFREDYICDKCGEGVMMPDGGLINHINHHYSERVLYSHKCSKCDKWELYDHYYPTITYEPVEPATAEADQPEPVLSDDELKSCPFCGGKAILYSSHDFGNVWYQGQCTECFAEAEQSLSISEAINNWNRRSDKV